MKGALPAGEPPNAIHRLNPARIVGTAENLAQQIGQRLPGSNLASIAAELARIARDTDHRVHQGADRSSPSGLHP